MRNTLRVCGLLILLAVVCLAGLRLLDDKSHGGNVIDPALHAPPEIIATMNRSCADCHSQGTHWPWYSHLPVIGPSIRSDVARARAVMNFSQWAERRDKFGPAADTILTAACADLRSRRMPLPKYLRLHPDARPSAAEIQAFCQWAQSMNVRATK